MYIGATVSNNQIIILTLSICHTNDVYTPCANNAKTVNREGVVFSCKEKNIMAGNAYYMWQERHLVDHISLGLIVQKHELKELNRLTQLWSEKGNVKLGFQFLTLVLGDIGFTISLFGVSKTLVLWVYK